MSHQDEPGRDKKGKWQRKYRKAVLVALIAVILAMLAYSVAQNALTTAEVNNVFEIVVNNTNLGPTSVLDPDVIGTGERLTNVTYWTNTSAIEIFLFTHANTQSATSDIKLYINGTKVMETGSRPLGAAEQTNRSLVAIIPKGANYSVTFLNYHHYEWREYPILSGKNGTLSINQTLVANLTYINESLANLNISKWNKTDNINASLQINLSQVNSLNNSLNLKINYTDTRFKIGNFNYNISDTYDLPITGIGFSPQYVTFMAIIDQTQYVSWGIDTQASAASSILADDGSSPGTYTFSQARSIQIRNGATWNARANIKTMDADGFTLQRAKTGTGFPTTNMTVFYTAFR